MTIRDLRRSAVHNLVSAGVDQVTARRISGHRPASVFQRYRIVDVDDTAAALAKTADAVRRARVSKVHVLRAGGRKKWWAGTGLNRRHQDFQV